jgi:hypothetical protein
MKYFNRALVFCKFRGTVSQGSRIALSAAEKSPLYHLFLYAIVGAVLALFCSGCSLDQIHAEHQVSDIALEPGDLEAHGLAFITPSTVTGQEEDKQSLAFVFANVLKAARPDVRVVTLPETLSAINQAGIADEYKLMYADYRDTGIFKRDTLRKVGTVTDARYLAQLKLSNFSQRSQGRFSLLGLRLFQTKEANIRLFLQIWNSDNGAIVWEATEELNYAWDTGREKPVTFKIVVEEIARNLVAQMP